MKRIMAIVVMLVTLFVSTVPSSAATATFEGQTITYNKVRSNDYIAYASISTVDATYVKAQITATYRLNGVIKTKTSSNENTRITSATVNVGTSGYITSCSSYYKARFYIDGAYMTWEKYY